MKNSTPSSVTQSPGPQLQKIMAKLFGALAAFLCAVTNAGTAVQTTLRRQRMSAVGRQEWLQFNTGKCGWKAD